MYDKTMSNRQIFSLVLSIFFLFFSMFPLKENFPFDICEFNITFFENACFLEKIVRNGYEK